MGDKSQTKLYSELLAFLDDRGRSLSEYGSSERGLRPADARVFLDMLLANGVPVLGIEIWRDSGNRLTIDGLETWYSEPGGFQSNHTSASQYVANVHVGANDLFAIQFG
jgi:hypothetical protein